MKKLAVCEYCGNIFMMGDRVWEYRGDKFCSEDCARKAEYLGKQGKWKNDIDKKEKENKEMKEIKLTIDGKEVHLTPEQLRLLGIETRKNPFERVSGSDYYYYIDAFDEIHGFFDHGEREDDESFNCVNYFNDKQFACQVALHQLLYRKLLKFAYDNGCEDNQIWGGNGIEHWTIRYNFEDRSFEPDWSAEYKYGGVYFSDREGVKRAINEVIIPFVKEHPEFVW